MTSTRLFVAFFLGVCVMLAGTAAFLGFADYDHHFQFERTTQQEPFDGATPYDQLSPEMRTMVDRAIDGERYTFQADRPVPPEAVRKGDTYYIFSAYRTFDWSDPGTFGPALVALAGLGIALQTARIEIRGGRPKEPFWRRWTGNED